jgi:hypothetical protein
MADVLLLNQLLEDDQNLLVALLRRRREQIRTRNEFSSNAVQPPTECSWTYLWKNGNDESFINLIGISR